MGMERPMEYLTKKLTEIHPYENNPRIITDAVEDVMESIRQCSYIAPIVIDEDGAILAGHTRYEALKRLGKTECGVVIARGLTEDQRGSTGFTITRHVINNHTYCGKIAYGKSKTVLKEGSDDEYHRVETDDYMVHKGRHEAIITEEVWDLHRRRRKRTAGGRNQSTRIISISTRLS